MKISRIDIIGQNGNDGEHYCKCETLILLRSLNLKMCPDCKAKYSWTLKENQKPLITSSADRVL